MNENDAGPMRLVIFPVAARCHCGQLARWVLVAPERESHQFCCDDDLKAIVGEETAAKISYQWAAEKVGEG